MSAIAERIHDLLHPEPEHPGADLSTATTQWLTAMRQPPPEPALEPDVGRVPRDVVNAWSAASRFLADFIAERRAASVSHCRRFFRGTNRPRHASQED